MVETRKKKIRKNYLNKWTYSVTEEFILDSKKLLKQAQVLRNKRIGRSFAQTSVSNGVVKYHISTPRPPIVKPMMFSAPSDPKPPKKTEDKPQISQKEANVHNQSQNKPPDNNKRCSKCNRKIGKS